MNRIWVVGVMLAITSCAPLKGSFVRTGYEQMPFDQAKAQCLYEVEMGFRPSPHYTTVFYGRPPPPGVAVGAAVGDAVGNIAIAIANAERQKNLYLRCMESRGYRFVPDLQ